VSATRGAAPVVERTRAVETVLDPYRVLFPLGIAFAIVGSAPWVFYAAGSPGYPGPLHRALMIQGFETSFVLGFLLTSIPAFTHGARCRPWELAGAALGPLVFGVAAFAGHEALAQGAFVATMLWLVLAAWRRVVGAKLAPPEEFLFVGVGLALGLAGGVLQWGAALGLWQEPSPRLGVHLVSLGMVLALVLGLGTMLVPVFAGMRDPLALPGIAAPHERPNRRRLYIALATVLVLSFAADALSWPAFGAVARLLVAATLGLLGWKLWRFPGRRALGAWGMWAAGWLVLIGLALAAISPFHAVAFHHLVFIGGYGLLTLSIGTRVVTGHGRFPVTDENRMLSPLVAGLLGLALATRVAAEFAPKAPHWLGASAALWILAWLAWSAGALPRIARRAAPAPPAGPVPLSIGGAPPRSGPVTRP
jgi:uncharacterized protein involved in response to NO